MTSKIRIGISSCLLGEKVRYDGGHTLDRYLAGTLAQYVDWVPVCPEVEFGLPVPREAMRLVGDPAAPRLITRKTGIDYTEGMLEWASKRVGELEREGLSGFIFKSKSPSSGLLKVKVYSPSGMPKMNGTGLFASTFTRHFPLLPVEDDGRLHDPVLRENFIERIFVFRRWQSLLDEGGALKDLVAFHTHHKLLVMSHSPRHYTLLGRLVAGAGKRIRKALLQEYISLLMDGLRLAATVKKNTNVLMHIAGYFKKRITADEKSELHDIIDNYHDGLVPLIVPVTLINHYVRKYDEPYLKTQHYLNPHPIELMLRNHV